MYVFGIAHGFSLLFGFLLRQELLLSLVVVVAVFCCVFCSFSFGVGGDTGLTPGAWGNWGGRDASGRLSSK